MRWREHSVRLTCNFQCDLPLRVLPLQGNTHKKKGMRHGNVKCCCYLDKQLLQRGNKKPADTCVFVGSPNDFLTTNEHCEMGKRRSWSLWSLKKGGRSWASSSRKSAVPQILAFWWGCREPLPPTVGAPPTLAHSVPLPTPAPLQ